MRYFRIVYFLFAFSTLMLAVVIHRALTAPGHLSQHDWTTNGICLVLWLAFGYYSYKSFSTDIHHAKGPMVMDRHFALKLSKKDAGLSIGPITGRGRCQIRLSIKRLSKGASCDEFNIVAISDGRPHGEQDSLPFTTNTSKFEVNVEDSSKWNITIDFRPSAKLNEDFEAEARLVVFGNCKELIAPEEMVTAT